MDFDLRKAQEKFEKEQVKRVQLARRRREKEQRLKEEAERIQKAVEESSRLKRLEASAVQEEERLSQESALHAGGGILFHKTLKIIPDSSNGDRIKLPPSALSLLEPQNATERGPMFFELTPKAWEAPKQEEDGPQKTHAGVLEFTAEEGSVGLPKNVLLNLERKNGGRKFMEAYVRYVRLPKATHAKLKPHSPAFSEVQNQKALLEGHLRHHSTLTLGDVLIVHHLGVEHAISVTELKPESAVSLIDTDVEVDIEAPETSFMEESSFLSPLEIGKAQQGKVLEGMYRYFKFATPEPEIGSEPSIPQDVVISLEIEGTSGSESGDADLYVDLAPVIYPTKHNHRWSNHEIGRKVITVPGDTLGGPKQFSVGVFGFRGTSTFSLLVELKDSRGVSAGGEKAMVDGAALEGSVRCGNCQQLVPERTLFLHEAYCRRNNVKCGFDGCHVVLRKEEIGEHVHCIKCGLGMKGAELEKHTNVYHTVLTCQCGVQLEMESMRKHREVQCPLRTIVCRFCGDAVPAEGEATNPRDRVRGFTRHESSCGSRTSPCDTCKRPIMLKEMDLHRQAVHEAKPFRVETSFPASMVTESADEYKECPVCSLRFMGADSEHQLSSHVEKHAIESSAADMDTSESEGLSTSDIVSRVGISNAFKTSLKVECPICGVSVHSERDLSQHIDFVH